MSTYLAAVCTTAGGPEVLEIEKRDRAKAKEGWVNIEIKAFGLNRAELFTRQGDSPGVEFPRVLGIECVGVVTDCPSGKFEPGQKVAAFMGGMGRDFDGGYAEFAQLPERCVLGFKSDLDWAILGAVPEMFQTANGSLEIGLELKAGESLLIRGGTSSIGLMAAQIASDMGVTVLSTTRSDKKTEALTKAGVIHVIIDKGGSLTASVKEIYPDGVDKVLELIGTSTAKDSLTCLRPQGICCMTGMLGGQWQFNDNNPLEPFLDFLNSVRFTAYGGETHNLSPDKLQHFLDRIAQGEASVATDRTFTLAEIADAHRYMEANRAKGKIVVVN